jgi:organic radical activating enzyme
MAGCNLSCAWCDTPFTWNWTGTSFKHPQKYDKKTESHKVTSDDLLGEIRRLGEVGNKTHALVVTGGEPLLQQARLPAVLKPLKDDKWWIEVETNGTIAPSRIMAECVDQFNVSPKLANSDEPLHRRIKLDVLKNLATADKVLFKFVVGGYEDAEEIEKLVKAAGIAPEKVWLMPKATTQLEHAENEPRAAFMAEKHEWNYTPRQQVLLWGNKRRV